MKTKIQISIGRRSDDVITIELTDPLSRIQFVDAEMTLEAFASAITGLSYVEMNAELRGLEHVGKVRVTEARKVYCPLKTYDRRTLEKWLEDNMQEEGWMLNSHLGSRDSMSYAKNAGKNLHYFVYRFVDPDGEKTP